MLYNPYQEPCSGTKSYHTVKMIIDSVKTNYGIEKLACVFFNSCKYFFFLGFIYLKLFVFDIDFDESVFY